MMPSMRSILVPLALLSLAAPIRAGSVLTDDFSDNALNASLWRVQSMAGFLSVNEVNQRLEITRTGQDDDGWGGVMLQSLALGDFDFQASYTLLTNIDGFNHDGTPSGVGLTWFGGTYFALRAVIDLGVNDIRGVYFGGQAEVETPWGFAFTSDTSGRLRVTRVGGMYTLSYWGPGNWVDLGPSTSAPSGAASLGLSVLVDGGNTLSMAFDDFYLQADGLETVPEPGAFGAAALGLGLLWSIRNRLSRSPRRRP